MLLKRLKMVRYNLGCGYDKKKGFVNIDSDARVNPDIVIDLSLKNWSRQLKKSDYIQSYHLLEHLPNTQWFLSNCKYLLKEGGILKIKVPCCFNTNGFEDPTHIKYFTPETFNHYSINKKHTHYNTKKDCNLYLLNNRLIFESNLDKFKHYLVRLTLNYSLSLSFVKEIEVTFIKK